MLTPLAVAPYFVGMTSIVYLVASSVLGLVFMALAVKVYRTTEGREADHAAKKLFGYSILYLFLIFALLLGESIATKLLA